MKNKKKLILTITLITTILVITLGITYAAFVYRENTNNQELITGSIYMRYNELDKIINISNIMPSEEYDENNYFEFEIAGKNTYKEKDIYYEIVLADGEYTGDDPNRTIPINDQLLRFKLVEVNDDATETVIFDNRSYSDITNKRIWVETISANDGNYSKTYRLYARIVEYTTICGGEIHEGCDYYVRPSDENSNLDWNKLYASIKVNVKGDLEEKSIETDASCFQYDIEYEGVSYTKSSSVSFDLNSNLSEEQLDTCASHILELEQIEFGTMDDETYNEYYGIYKSLCNGETISGLTFKMFTDQVELQGGSLDYDYLQEEGIISNYQGIVEKYVNSDTAEELDINSIDKDKANIILTSYDTAKCGVDVVIPKKINDINVTILQGKPGYGGGAERVFDDVKNVVIPNTITTIGQNAFYDGQLINVEIPNSVTTIGIYAFYGNQLTSVEIPNSVTTIGMYAFQNNQLTSVEIPNSVTTIGEDAFSNNQLRSVTISNGVTTIDSSAFSYNQLTSVKIPDSVTTIGSAAFFQNYLTNVEIPDSVVYIGAAAFNNNFLPDSQALIYRRTDNDNDGIAEIDNTTIVSYGGINKQPVIPSNVTTIGSSAFSVSQLTSVTIPDSVTTIDAHAFSDNQLASVTIESGIQYIGNHAFNDNQLTNVTIPDSVTTIGSSAFSHNQLTNVTIPDSVTTIEDDAFSDNQLTSVTIESGIQYIGNSAFEKNLTSNPNLSSIIINKSCSDIKNITNSTHSAFYYPWLSSRSPYTASGVTIYGTGSEVCGSY